MAITLQGTASVQSGSGTTCTFSVSGLGIQSGDVIIAVVNHNYGPLSDNQSGTYPFTMKALPIPVGDVGADMIIAWRVAGGSEPTSYSFSAGGSDRYGGALRVYRGVHANVWDVSPNDNPYTSNSTGSTSAQAPSQTIGYDGDMGIVINCSDATVTCDSVNNSYGNLISTTSSGQTVGMCDRLFASTGSTGATTITLSSSNDWTCWQCLLRPAAASVTAAITGTLDGSYESDVVDGGKTIIITLTGDTWIGTT